MTHPLNAILARSAAQILACLKRKNRDIGIKYQYGTLLEVIMPTKPFDAIDRNILTHLQQDGRKSNQDLSELVGLSPSPCLRRVRLLEESGVISGYVALVSPDAAGLSVSAFVRVRLSSQDDRHLEEFERLIVTFPEIMECYLMTGESDYQLRVLVESLAAFEDFLRHKLTRIPSVVGVTSSFALRPIVYRTALPLPETAPPR